MNDVVNSIRPELLVVSVLLYGVGVVLKKSKFKDNYIPLVLGAIGIVVGVCYCGAVDGFNMTNIISGVVQGVLCASGSTYVNQVIKQLLKNNNIDEKVIDMIEDLVEGENDE